MNEPLTSYTCRSRNTNVIWIFRFNLEGQIKSFEIHGDALTSKQVNWLFSENNFPVSEDVVLSWKYVLKKNFEIFKEEFDITFLNFYALYDYKVGKQEAEKAWNKLSKKDKISAIIGVKHYNNYLKRNNGIAKTYPSTYLNKRRWESDYRSL